MKTIPDYFGCNVFDNRVMKEMLPVEAYNSLKTIIDEGTKFDPSLADVVAEAMKEWAISKGATHYTHWFHPLTGVTAEKHDSFISPAKEGGVIMEFSGKELIQGEPDASSFPSGGLRATFEARGYTTWDPTSFAFIKGKTLCIPTAFCSYGGEALDKKTPLLRSMEALNREALRILRLFGRDDVKRVITYAGVEQEYFLVTKEVLDRRPDLRFTGRTLFGCRSPKGQEMDDHYFGPIKPKVARFMEELNEELWKLGVYAKTEHNEAAPAQHELAPIYTTANVATDHNQIIMEVMQKVAMKHGLVCLLHEKPFEGINGSGKHNNWSIATDKGQNLLSPGDTPYDNAQFLLFLSAVIEAADEYQDLLRISAATAGNDHRLGASEAPPAVVSMFLGDELTAVLEAIESDMPYEGAKKMKMKLGADVLPIFLRDTTDRNRTSPLAFTGNKFEFRMVGSSDSVACANIMMNASVASVLKKYADRLEKAENFEDELHCLIRNTVREHKRIIFNGNGYDDVWLEEAVKVRGLHNYPTTPDALPHIMDEKNVKMLGDIGVYSETEVRARCEIILDNYAKTVMIEAYTMASMTRTEILPAILEYTDVLAEAILSKQAADADLACGYDKKVLKKLSALADVISETEEKLTGALEKVKAMEDIKDRADAVRDRLLDLMTELRSYVDQAEMMTSKKYWPYPTYGDILFSVKE